MQNRVARKTEVGERGIIELKAGAFRVPSFTDPSVTYLAHPESGYCQCPHYSHTGTFCKHLTTAEAIGQARARKFGAQIAEERVTELCSKLFAPLKGESCRGSYDLLLEVLASRHSTDAMVRAAMKRHHRILGMHDSGPRRAA